MPRPITCLSTVRSNSGTAPALWSFWDDVRINETVSMGWVSPRVLWLRPRLIHSSLFSCPSQWEDDLPVAVNYTCGAAGNAEALQSVDGVCAAWNVTTNGYYDGDPCGQPAGNVGCFSALSVDAAKASCCENPLCAGFSTVPNGNGTFNGCYKRSQSCFRSAQGDAGYYKPGFVPPPDPNSAVLATTYSAFGRYAIIVLASYCPGSSTSTLALDWVALGLNQATVTMTAPAIAGVQSAASFPDPAGPYSLPGDGGIILVLQ